MFLQCFFIFLTHLASRCWLQTMELERTNLLILLPLFVKARKRSRKHVSRMNFIVRLDITSR